MVGTPRVAWRDVLTIHREDTEYGKSIVEVEFEPEGVKGDACVHACVHVMNL